LWCEITTGTPSSRPMRSLLERIDDAVALVAHVRAVDGFLAVSGRHTSITSSVARRARLVVQPVEKPIAPASSASSTMLLIRDISRGDALLEILHRLHAQHRVTDEQRAVGGRRLRPQRST